MTPINYDWPDIFTSSYRVTGTKAYRLASSQFLKPMGRDLPGFGSNGQNRSDEERRLFRPPAGYKFVQCDLEGAEAVAVALLCQEGQFRDLVRLRIKPHNFMCVQLFPEKFTELLDVSNVRDLTPRSFYELPQYKDVVKHCKTLHREYDLAKRTVHGCLTADHEVLTPTGWVAIDQWKSDQPIMVFDAARNQCRFEQPQHYTKIDNYAGPLHTITNATGSVDITITDTHRVLYSTNGNLKVCTPSCLPKGAGFPCSATKPNTNAAAVKGNFARLMAAWHSDGSTNEQGRVQFHLRKPRKRLRLLALLTTIADDYRMYHNCDDTVTIVCSDVLSTQLRQHNKPAQWDLLVYWDASMLQTYLDEYVNWDGHETETARRLCTTDKQQADFLFTAARLVGYGSSIMTIERDESRQTIYNIGLNNRTLASYSSCDHATVEVTGTPVYCFTVSTSYFFVRRRKCIMITGNSNYSMGWKTFRDTVLKNTRGRVLLTAKEAKAMLALYFVLFPEVRMYQAVIEEKVRAGMPICNLFGHHVVLLARFTTELARLAISWGPQSTVGQCSNIAAVRFLKLIYNEHPNWHLHNITHDSILASAPDDEAELMSRKLADCMSFRFTSPVDGWEAAIGVERQLGSNWGKYSKDNPTGLKVINN